jgi:hypothetical protein
MKRVLLAPGLTLFLFVLLPCITSCPTDGDGLPQSPPPVAEPDETLANTMWVWESMGTTLDFTSATEVSNGIETYIYSYVDSDKAGSIETLGDFILSDDGGALSFPAYNGAMQAEFRRYVEEPEAFPETLANTQWKWEAETLIFHTEELVQLGADYYKYTYNRETKTGIITDRDGAKLAEFGLNRNAKTLSLISATYPEGANFLPKGEIDLTLDDLVGSKWSWNSVWSDRVLTFTTEDIVELSDVTSSDAYQTYYWYTYDKETKKGSIIYAPTLNERILEDPANLGSFTINATYSALSFIQYKDYPHGAKFDRIPPEE